MKKKEYFLCLHLDIFELILWSSTNNIWVDEILGSGFWKYYFVLYNCSRD